MSATTTYSPTSAEAARYHAILNKRIEEGATRAARVIEDIHTNMPKDAIVPTGKVGFYMPVEPAAGGIRVGWSDVRFAPTDYALSQLAERAEVPAKYLRDLAAEDGTEGVWRRELACEILSKSYANLPRQRVLARTVKGQLRGWLSDSFRRLDSRPLVEALALAAAQVGAVPVDGLLTETRVVLKVLFPEVLEPIPGEYVALGVEWSNSDYGNGTHSLREFVLRVACLNGMTRENLLRQFHLGAKLQDNIEYSDRTLRLDTAASVSALRDVVGGSLGQGARDKLAERLRAANAKEFSAKELRGALRNFPNKTVKAAVDAFEGEDVINLPAEQTAWRASNAISWVARHTESAEVRLDLERAAGSVVE